MTIRDMIESGMVEAYVLGQLDLQQRQQFEEALQRSPELQAELARVEETLEPFARMHAVEPPAGMREQIWEAIQERSAPPLSQEQPVPTLQRWQVMLGAIAATELVLLIVGAIWVWRLSAALEQRQHELDNLQQRYEQSISALKAQLTDVRDAVRLMWGKAVVVPLKETGKQPAARASVCWDTASGQLFLAMPMLAPLPTDQAYQLWALADGKPIDAGVFVPDSVRLVYPLKTVNAADGFAVTVEPRGGSATPTLSTMVLIGKLPRPAPRWTERGTR